MTVYCNDCRETGVPRREPFIDTDTMAKRVGVSCAACGGINIQPADQLIDEAEARLTNR